MTLNKYFKQIEYVDDLLNKKKWTPSIKSDLKTIAKKLYHDGITDSESLYKNLNEYCKSKGKSWYNESKDYLYIEKAIKEAMSKEKCIIQIKNITITFNEWNFIKGLNYSEREKKILFGIMVHSKLNTERSLIQTKSSSGYYFGGGGKYSYKTLLESLNEKYTRTFLDKEIHKVIRNFNIDGLTKTNMNTSIKLLFMDNIEFDVNVKLKIYNFDKIGLYWEMENGNCKIKYCEDCKTLIECKTHNKKYCEDCRDNKNKEIQRVKYIKNKFT